MNEPAGRLRKQLIRKFGRKIVLYVTMGVVSALCNVLSVVELQKALDILSSDPAGSLLAAVSRPVLLFGVFPCCAVS